MAFLNKGLRIILRDQRPEGAELADIVEDTLDGEAVEVDDTDLHAVSDESGARSLEQIFLYERGLADYVDFLNKRKHALSPVISFEAETGDSAANPMSLELAMQWQGSSYNESVHTFANTINTPEGGTHEEASVPR